MPEPKRYKKLGREKAKEAARKSEQYFVRQSGQVKLPMAALSPQLVFLPLSAHLAPAHHPCWTQGHCTSHVTRSSPPAAKPCSQVTFAADSGSHYPPLSPEKMCLNLYPTYHSWGMCISAIQHMELNLKKKKKTQTNVEHDFSICFCFLGVFGVG